MIKTTALAAGFLLGASSLGQAATCHVPPFKLIRDVTVTAAMYVTSGKRCSIIVLNSAGGTRAFEITRGASHGRAELANPLKLTYTPAPGFVGKDSFSYVSHSHDARTNRPMDLPVNVDVTVMTGNVR